MQTPPLSARINTASLTETIERPLFLVCPFSCLEPFINRHFGKSGYFLTGMGANFQQQDERYWQEVRQAIRQQNINTVYLVCDTDCRFLQQAMTTAEGESVQAVDIMRQLREQHAMSFHQDMTDLQQRHYLAELYLRQQIALMTTPDALGGCPVKIKGLITTKSRGSIMALQPLMFGYN
jgi:carbonic anhydrase